MPEVLQMKSRVTILRAQQRRLRLDKPVLMEGRTFTQEIGTSWEPYHRRLAASVTQTTQGPVVTLRHIRDVTPDMRIEVDGVQYAIASIEQREQQIATGDGKKAPIKFTDLQCVPVSE